MAQSHDTRVLILGASRGLGLAMAAEWCARGAHVSGTVRRPSADLQALADRYPGQIAIETADLDDVASLQSLREVLDGRRIDILIVNGGVSRGNGLTPVTIPDEDYLSMLRTNVLGPARAMELLHDLVPAGGVIAAMSSGLASIGNSRGKWPFYSSSKAALNMMIKTFALEHGAGRAVLAVAPGWVQTGLGGSDAPLTVEEAIPPVVDMVEANRGYDGLRYLDRFDRDVPW